MATSLPSGGIALAIAAAALSGAAIAQPTPEAKRLLLPDFVHLQGTIVGPDGKALSGVAIGHTNYYTDIGQPDAEGRFDLSTRAPAIVFRKEGYRSRYLRVERDASLEIRLQPVDKALDLCSPSASCAPLPESLSEFCLPRVKGVRVGALVSDCDYVVRAFTVRTQAGRRGIGHASGVLWGSGLPHDEDVWSAVEYSETSYRDSRGFPIVDARGKAANGRCWRVLGRFNETAYYRDVPEEAIGLLDKTLDGVCARPTGNRPPSEISQDTPTPLNSNSRK